MIGPKKFTRAERDDIQSRVRQLEEEARITDEKALELCTRRNQTAGRYERKFSDFIRSFDAEDILSVYTTEHPFSPYSPNISFKGLVYVDVAKGQAGILEDLLDTDVIRELRMEELEQQSDAQQFNRESRNVIMQQEEIHEELVFMTMAEMPYKQKIKFDRAVLYISEPTQKSLIRAKIDLSRAVYTQEPHRTGLPNIPIQSKDALEMRRMMKLQGRGEKANVYFVHNMSPRIRAEEMLYEVKTELQAGYDQQNPEKVRKRLDEMRKRDDSRAQRRIMHDFAAGKVLVNPKGHMIAIVDSNGRISPHLDLDLMMEDDLAKTRLFIDTKDLN